MGRNVEQYNQHNEKYIDNFLYVYLYVILRPAGQCFCSNRYVIIHVEGLQNSGLCLTPTSSDKEGTSLCKPVVSWGLGFCGLIRRTGHFSPLATSKDYWGLLKIFLSRTIEALHLASSPILPMVIQGMKCRRQLTLAFWNRQLHWRGPSYESTKTKVPFYSRCNMIKTTPCSVGTVSAEHWSEICSPSPPKVSDVSVWAKYSQAEWKQYTTTSWSGEWKGIILMKNHMPNMDAIIIK